MAEEHRCEAPEGHRLCVNNCGFFGSAATMNLCSKCYRDYCLKEQQQQQASFSLPSFPPPSSQPLVADLSASVEESTAEGLRSHPTTEITEVVTVASEQKPNNRCFVCRKRVGLTGFRCRCESMFCGTHRYPEKHNCSFDFKKVGREEIARANPLVVAEKLHKI